MVVVVMVMMIMMVVAAVSSLEPIVLVDCIMPDGLFSTSSDE